MTKTKPVLLKEELVFSYLIFLRDYNDTFKPAPTVLALGTPCKSNPRILPAPAVLTWGSKKALGAIKNTLLANTLRRTLLIFILSNTLRGRSYPIEISRILKVVASYTLNSLDR